MFGGWYRRMNMSWGQIAAIALLMLSGIGGAGAYHGLREQTASAAAAFAADHDVGQCLQETARRAADCSSALCRANTAEFGNQCQRTAQGNLGAFCTGLHARDARFTDGSWVETYCDPNNLDAKACAVVSQVVRESCDPEVALRPY